MIPGNNLCIDLHRCLITNTNNAKSTKSAGLVLDSKSSSSDEIVSMTVK